MSVNPLSIESLCEGLDAPSSVLNFEHLPGGRVVFGPGKFTTVGDEAAALGANHVLIVSDPGIAQIGAVEKAVHFIKAAGLKATIFDQVHENPTTDDVEACVAVAKESKVDLIVGLGGGSSLDTAKGCNFILTNGGTMHDYWGVGLAKRPMLPLIAIPTTSGTGSECQSFALIADAETHAKMACGDKKAAATVAILDPELTVTMPAAVTAHTGIDAIAHALETAVCNKRSKVSYEYSKAAWQLLNDGLESAMNQPDDMVARARMQLGAAFAGIAIENSMLGIGHSCANPVTAHYGIVHGQAVGTMMPEVVAFNRLDDQVASIYRELYEGDLAERLRTLLVSAEMNLSLADLGVEPDKLPQLAEEAAKQWTAQFNPICVDAVALERVYRAAMGLSPAI